MLSICWARAQVPQCPPLPSAQIICESPHTRTSLHFTETPSWVGCLSVAFPHWLAHRVPKSPPYQLKCNGMVRIIIKKKPSVAFSRAAFTTLKMNPEELMAINVESHTTMNCEVFNRHWAGHLSYMGQIFFIQTSGRASHASGLAIQSEETWGSKGEHI